MKKKKKNNMQSVLEKIFAYLLSIKSLKIYFQFVPVHTSRKTTYTNMYRTKKINQSIFKSSWVFNLPKCMHVMCKNNEKYVCKNARWIKKTI